MLLPLERAIAHDARLVGHKALGCARMMQMGMRVPQGFVLTTEAFEQHLRDTGLQEHRARLFAVFLHQRDTGILKGAAADFGRLLVETPLDEALCRQLETVGRSPDALWAVRSSHTLEDGQQSAFAGIYDTVLGVPSAELDTAIRRVWASAFSYRALRHTLEMGLSPWDVSGAVLIQTLVDVKFSGILYTRDPGDGDRRKWPIVGHAGWGEALVSGRDSGLEGSLYRHGRVEAMPHLGLTRADCDRLRTWGRKLEKMFNEPVDIEWAHNGQTLYLVQVRPLTCFKGDQRPIHWDRELAEERFPDPISPLGWSCLQNAFRVNLNTLEHRFGLGAKQPEDVARTFGHYVYSNADFFKIPQSLRLRWASQLRFVPRYVSVIVDSVRPIAFLRRLGKPRPSVLGTDPGDPRFMAVTGLFGAFVFTHAREIANRWEQRIAGHLMQVDALNDPELSGMNDAELRRFMDHVIVTGNCFMEPDLAIFVIKSACIWMLEELLRMCGLPPTDLRTLTAGLANNVTLDLGQAVAELAQAIACEPALQAAWGDATPAVLVQAVSQHPALAMKWHAFMNTYGHVTTTWDIRVPTWQEAPESLVFLLRKSATRPPELSDRRDSLRANAQQRLFDALAGWPRAKAFSENLLDTLYRFMRYDEDHHMQSSRLFRPSRRVFSELARRFVAKGILRAEDELYFLRMDEIEAMFACERPYPLWYLASRRRESFARAWLTVPPKVYLGDRPQPVPSPVLIDGLALRGTAASPGRAKGRVRHVASPDHLNNFQSGDILVTRSPNPAWTPLFATAGGLVTASGSALSHGFISAREYGLPAVSGIAIETLVEGQLIVVDGSTGIVHRLEETGVNDDHHAAV